ncbi:MAG: translation elongation factor Ts [Bacteroidia bacterium]|nr:translation elongation factor Ts [Bacteroidia bacterium]
MGITAKEVNELRQKTGAGMMDCKKALEEANGDFEAAIEFLRKKGQKISASRQDRDAKEGAIFAKISGSTGILIELNCETDFVARNSDFQALGESIANLAIQTQPATLEELRNHSINGRTVTETLTDYMGKIGEKLEVSKYGKLSGEAVVSYIHAGARIGVLVAFSGIEGVSNIETVGRDVAMQIASMNPIAIDKDTVDASIVQKEIEIGKEQARQEGKPEAMLEKIAIGKLGKFYKENTLVEQDFVKDPTKTIAQYLKENGANLKVTSFMRFELGAK